MASASVLGVGDDDRAGLSATGNVNDAACILGILDQSLDGGGVGGSQRYDTFHRYHVSVAYVNEIHKIGISLSLNILDLLADLLQLGLDLHYQLCNSGVGAFGAGGVDLAVDLLQKEINAAANRLIRG